MIRSSSKLLLLAIVGIANCFERTRPRNLTNPPSIISTGEKNRKKPPNFFRKNGQIRLLNGNKWLNIHIFLSHPHDKFREMNFPNGPQNKFSLCGTNSLRSIRPLKVSRLKSVRIQCSKDWSSLCSQLINHLSWD